MNTVLQRLSSGWRASRLAAAVVALSVLPSVVGGAVLLAQHAPSVIPYEGTVEYLANKNMSYWFLALAAVAIASWSFIAKWLLNQLESQRKANAELVAKLVNYMEVDHSKTLVVMDSVTKILADIVHKLDTLNGRRQQHEGQRHTTAG